MVISTALMADPILVRGADGSYLPVLAEQWHAKGGGVVLKIKKGVDIDVLKERLAEKFPEQTIEIRGEHLYFASVEIDALLHLLAGVDVGVSLPQDLISLLREKKDLPENITLPLDQRIDLPIAELAEVEVTATSFSGVDALVKSQVVVRTPPSSGEFTKLKGTITIKAFFKMKKKKVDVEDEDNQRKSDLLIAQPKSLLYLRITKKDSDDAYLVSEAHLKKY